MFIETATGDGDGGGNGDSDDDDAARVEFYDRSSAQASGPFRQIGEGEGMG